MSLSPVLLDSISTRKMDTVDGFDTLSRCLYGALSPSSFVPFALIVLLGYLIGLSDNVAVIARKRQER